MSEVTERFLEDLEIEATTRAEEMFQEFLKKFYGPRAQAHMGMTEATPPDEGMAQEGQQDATG